MKSLFCCLTLLLSASILHATPDIDVTTTYYDFGPTDIGLTQTITITYRNIGTSSLTVYSLSATADTDFTITPLLYLPITTSPSTGYYWSLVRVSWTPTRGGPNTALLEITSSDPDESTVEVLITGSGIPDYVEPAEQIIQLVDFTEEAIATGDITGAGKGNSPKGHLRAFQNLLDEAEYLIANDAWSDALDVLASALKRVDGENRPPDFIQGPAAEEIADRIRTLIEDLS